MTVVTQYHVEHFRDDKTRALTEEHSSATSLGTHDGLLYRGFQLHARTATTEPYLSQHYTGGIVCDIGKKLPRRTEVQFFCEPESATAVKSMSEVSTCSYVMKVGTNLLCDHEAFLSLSETQVKEIVCEAIPKKRPDPELIMSTLDRAR
jgi:hypothetical protein